MENWTISMKFGRGRRGERKSRIYTHKAIFYNKYTGNIEIPETIEHKGNTYGVTTIRNNAFEMCSKLISVIIPNSMTYIGERAFFNCI